MLTSLRHIIYNAIEFTGSSLIVLSPVPPFTATKVPCLLI